MKLFYQDSTIEINLDTTKINYLCIERHSVFRHMILELYEQYNGCEGPWIYNVNAKGVPIDKSLHVIMNPIQVDVNSKAILTKLNANLVKESNLMMEDLQDTVSKLHQFFYKLEFGSTIAIEHKEEIVASDIIKLGAFKIHESDTDAVERLVDYIDIVYELLNPDVFVIINIDMYLDSEELHKFFKTILAKQLCVLCISSGSYGLDDIEKSLINGYTLDSDFCLI